MERPFPSLGDESRLRHTKALVERLIVTRTSEHTRAWSWAEGWRLGMEEVLYKIGWDLHYLD
jgi:hypothetical protein